MKHVVVRYVLKAERVTEHEALLAAVFEELSRSGAQGLAYEVLKLADGVTFVHHATVDAEKNPLLELEAFKRFSAQIGDRCVQPPVSSPATLLGSHPRA